MTDYDFDGADADALAMLSDGSVGGVDYVGQQYITPHAMAGRRGGGLNPALAAAGLRAFAMAKKVAQDRKLRHQALAGFIPQTMIHVSTAAGVTIAPAGALALSAAPGVPCRVTKYTVEPAIASFYAITAITAARMNMVAGGVGVGVPATRFLPTSVQAPIDNPTLGAGAPITVLGTNVDGAAHGYFSSFDAIDLTPTAARLT